MSEFDPSDEQLEPYHFTADQFRALREIAKGNGRGTLVEVCRVLQQRGFVTCNAQCGESKVTPQGEAFLRSITELLAP